MEFLVKPKNPLKMLHGGRRGVGARTNVGRIPKPPLVTSQIMDRILVYHWAATIAMHYPD